MNGFQNILVYASLEDDAFLAVEQAASLARGTAAQLTVVRVLEDAGLLNRLLPRGGDPEHMKRLIEQSQRVLLEERVKPLREEGIGVRVEVRWGSPWLELLYCVLREGHDLVIKTAEGAARGSGLFFGSTAMHLIRKCPCPVWVVSGLDHARGSKVLAAIDPASDGKRSAVAEQVLELASCMAGDRGELHAATAWRAAGETLLRKRVPPKELQEYVSSAREEARCSLQRVLETGASTIAAEHVHLVKGEARDVLSMIVERDGFDLVVMGSLGRAGIAGLLIGETAETVIRSVRCSVLVVKPPGFECPIELPRRATSVEPSDHARASLA